MLPVCPCLARRSLSPDSGVAAILSSLTQSPGEQSTLFHVVVKQLNTESRSVVSELQQAPEFAHFTVLRLVRTSLQHHCSALKSSLTSPANKGDPLLNRESALIESAQPL